MPGISIAQKVKNWRFLVEQSRPLLTEAPHLVAEHAALEAVIAEVEAAEAKSEHMRGDRLETNRLRREAEARGSESRTRLAAALVHHFGPKSEKLYGFGIVPRAREVKRTTKAEQELAVLKEKEAQQAATVQSGVSGTPAPTLPK